jgi:hypothetical protein
MTSYEARDGRDGTEIDLSTNFFGIPPLITIPPLFHTQLSPPPGVSDRRDGRDRSTHYHSNGLVGWRGEGASSVTSRLAGDRVR